MKINPKIVDGEPVCSFEDCVSYCQIGAWCTVLDNLIPTHMNNPVPCIPALRQQRDEARRVQCEQEAHDLVIDGYDPHTAQDVAKQHSWNCYDELKEK